MDSVKNPAHYHLEGLEGVESIDILRAVAGQEMFKGFCLCNILKYIIRAEKKNGIEDYRKAKQYLEWLIELEEE